MGASSKKIISLFSGCGGLDLGFRQAGFEIIWANEYDKSIWDTYKYNHPDTELDRRDVRKIKSSEIPDSIGIIGGPPCQSWSEAGAGRGINDHRGQLFHEYIRIITDKKPLFFLAENVSGILAKRHRQAFQNILTQFEKVGYKVKSQLLNAHDFEVPQDRKRVIIIGYKEELGRDFNFPKYSNKILTLKEAIYDLRNREPRKLEGTALVNNNSLEHKAKEEIYNHEYLDGGFSSIYMSRNRVRSWDEPSFTIQAGGRHAPLHPQAKRMIFIEKDKWKFDPDSPQPYRRLSVRECARIQTFPDNFIFKYSKIADGYKMVGNAVPVKLAEILAKKISKDLQQYQKSGVCKNVYKEKYTKQLAFI
ncbi:MAG: DNA cytosine methyltransferase [Symploca sp. SIO2B6]|nr:DNA cytosine methyltransferase [Symploca sp. SIO2B6]